MNSISSENVSSQSLDHLGIVAGVLKRARIKELVNEALGDKAQVTSKLTVGDCICAMILNGLGFANRALYLVSSFFEGKPIELLLSPGISAKDLTDDSLGTSLDIIAKFGPTNLYAEIAFRVALDFELLDNSRRIDSTSISLEGEYLGFGDSPETAPQIITITNGHSKQHRPDLKQTMMNLVNTGKSGFPLWMEALNGNSSDKKTFHQTIERVEAFQSQFKSTPSGLWIADSALYTKDALLAREVPWKWLTRVPETNLQAKALVEKPHESFHWKDVGQGYRLISVCPLMQGTSQRWVLVFSQEAYEREIKTFKKNLEKEKNSAEKALGHFSSEGFACAPDAKKALEILMKKFPHFSAEGDVEEKPRYSKKGRPGKKAEPVKTECFMKATLKKNEEVIARKMATKGRFILATNQMDESILSDADMLKEYKGLSTVERGFRFLKDPWFMVSQVYLKKPNRIAALMCIMTMTLMAYSLGETFLRESLKERHETLPNQLKKEVQNPTLRWVFQMMDGVALVSVLNGKTSHRVVTNVNALRERIILCFGTETAAIYDVKIGKRALENG